MLLPFSSCWICACKTSLNQFLSWKKTLDILSTKSARQNASPSEHITVGSDPEWWVKDCFSGTDASGVSSVLGHLSWAIKSRSWADMLCYVENGCCPSLWIKQQWLWPNKENWELSLLGSFPAWRVCEFSVLGREGAPAQRSRGSRAFLADAAWLTGDTRAQYAPPRLRPPIWLLLIHYHLNSKQKQFQYSEHSLHMKQIPHTVPPEVEEK